MSGTSGSNCVVAYGNLKDAALYFDYVVPFPGEAIYSRLEPILLAIGLGKNDSTTAMELVKDNVVPTLPTDGRALSLLPPKLKDDGDFKKLLVRTSSWQCFNSILDFMELFAPPEECAKAREAMKQVNRQLHVSVGNNSALAKTHDVLLHRYGLTKLPALQAETLYSKIFSEALGELLEEVPDLLEDEKKGDVNESTNLNEKCGLTLANLRLIDTSNVSWDQLFQLREDKDSLKKLSNLRRFFITNYEGRSNAYIEADLLKRLEDYEETARTWGMDTLLASVEACVKSSHMAAATWGAIAFAMTNQLDKAALTAGGIEFAGLMLSVVRERRKVKREIHRHELAYIIKARESLKASGSPG